MNNPFLSLLAIGLIPKYSSHINKIFFYAHSNCQAVHDYGGLKTLCELTAATNSENVLERVIWTLGLLAVDSK